MKRPLPIIFTSALDSEVFDPLKTIVLDPFALIISPKDKGITGLDHCNFCHAENHGRVLSLLFLGDLTK